MRYNIVFGASQWPNISFFLPPPRPSLSAVARMTDDESKATFQRIRRADNGGEPYCPQCGCLTAYKLASRPVWKCGGCAHQFSVTSGPASGALAHAAAATRSWAPR
jgi:ribosomal protein L37AE/L43A